MNFDINKLPNGTEAVLKGKMMQTLALVEGYSQEANGDAAADENYDWSIDKVKEALYEIKLALYDDITLLANDIDKACEPKIYYNKENS